MSTRIEIIQSSIQINVNSVDVGDVVSVKTIDVNVTDENGDEVTPLSTTLTGNTLGIVFNDQIQTAIEFENRVIADGGTLEYPYELVLTIRELALL